MELLSLPSKIACGMFTLPLKPISFGFLDDYIYTVATQLHIAAATFVQLQQLYITAETYTVNRVWKLFMW